MNSPAIDQSSKLLNLKPSTLWDMVLDKGVEYVAGRYSNPIKQDAIIQSRIFWNWWIALWCKYDGEVNKDIEVHGGRPYYRNREILDTEEFYRLTHPPVQKLIEPYQLKIITAYKSPNGKDKTNKKDIDRGPNEGSSTSPYERSCFLSIISQRDRG